MEKRTITNAGGKQLTPRQIAFARNVVKGTTIIEAARKAGYSEKNLAQSGHQALKAIRLRAPELMDDLGLSLRVLIEKHLVPLLSATTIKHFQYKGKVKQVFKIPDNSARLRALNIALILLGAYATTDSKLNEPKGIEVIIVDVPRPDRSAINLYLPRLPSPETGSLACPAVREPGHHPHVRECGAASSAPDVQ
jgi:hypothetical protein